MSVHTAEIYTQILKLENVVQLMRAFNFNDNQISRIENDTRHKKVDEFIPLSEDNPLGGIEQINIIRFYYKKLKHHFYYAYLRINPQMLITHKRSIELYIPSTENNLLLQEQFRILMNSYINIFVSDQSLVDLNLVELSNWKCRRIDYSHNFIFDSEKEMTAFYNLTKRTSKYKGRRNKKRIKDVKKYDQSTAEANKSSKILIYNKQKQILDVYNDLPEEDIVALDAVSQNTIRFEVQCYKSKVRNLKTAHDMDDLGIMNFMNEDYAHCVLLKSYIDSVGTGDFYYFYGAQRELRKSNIKPAMQIRIFNLLRLITQARSLAEGREQYVSGGHTIQKTCTIVEGSAVTFRNYMKKLATININPVLIPKDWGVKYLKNPIDDLMFEP